MSLIGPPQPRRRPCRRRRSARSDARVDAGWAAPIAVAGASDRHGCGRARRRWARRPSFVDQEHGLPGQRSHYLVLASVNRTALHHHVRASQQPFVPSARRPAAPRLRPRPSASRPSPRRSTPSLRTSATRQRSVGSSISTRACSTATTQVGPSARRSIERATTPITRTESTRQPGSRRPC